MKIIKGDLILEEDTIFNESIRVKGSIKGYFNLNVCGNIDCRDIDCRNIDCRDIVCRNIYCRDIDCGNIDCWNIDCLNIDCGNIDCRDIDCGNIVCGNIDCRNIDCRNIVLCEKIKLRRGCKVKAKMLIQNRSKLEIKEQKIKGDEK